MKRPERGTSSVERRFQNVRGIPLLWAVAVKGARTVWINFFTLAGTKRDSEGLYIKQWNDPAIGSGYLARGEARAIKVRLDPIRINPRSSAVKKTQEG